MRFCLTIVAVLFAAVTISITASQANGQVVCENGVCELQRKVAAKPKAQPTAECQCSPCNCSPCQCGAATATAKTTAKLSAHPQAKAGAFRGRLLQAKPLRSVAGRVLSIRPLRAIGRAAKGLRGRGC